MMFHVEHSESWQTADDAACHPEPALAGEGSYGGQESPVTTAKARDIKIEAAVRSFEARGFSG